MRRPAARPLHLGPIARGGTLVVTAALLLAGGLLRPAPAAAAPSPSGPPSTPVAAAPSTPAPAPSDEAPSTGRPIKDGLKMVAHTNDPLASTIVLTNNTGVACQVATTSLGTVGITALRQGGKIITPTPTDPSFPDGFDAFLADHLTTLAPGASTTIPLRSIPTGDTGHALETVTWSALASLGMLYPVEASGALELSATYAMPAMSIAGPPPCPATATAPLPGIGRPVIPGGGGGGPLPLLYVAMTATALFLLVVILYFVLLLRDRRQGRGGPGPTTGRPTTGGPTTGGPTTGGPTTGGPTTGGPTGATAGAAALLLLAALSTPLWSARPAYATISVDPSLQQAYAQCAPLFSSDGGDPAGIFPVLNDPSNTVEIIPANGDQTHEIAAGPHHVIIFWDPNDHHAYTGGGTADPCTSFYYAAYHGKEDLTGGQDHSPCVTTDGDSGLPVNEVNATRAQNLLRVKLGLPPRTTYGRTPLPVGQCLPKDRQPPPRVACTGAGCADSNGDPHLTTFDGLRYNFQAAGEFVAARQDSDPGFQIQVRQQPVTGTTSVAVDTAVAMSVAGDKVEVDLTIDGMQLVVDGHPAPLAAYVLPNGGSVALDIDAVPQHLITQWPDGSKVVVSVIGVWGLHVVAQPAPARANKLAGLLGNFDGSPVGDLRTSSGATLPDAPNFGDLYPGFADSWRVTGATSLFTYPLGASTATYTDRDFPADPVDPLALPGADAASMLCRTYGITDTQTLSDCILDVALTGQAEFAAADKATQDIVAPAPTPGPSTTPSPGPDDTVLQVNDPGGTAHFQFTGQPGRHVYVAIESSSVVNACGVVNLLAPDGGTLVLGCVGSDGTGNLDELLTTTGTYSIAFSPGPGQTGQVRIRLIFSSDFHGTLPADGSPAIASIVAPGEAAYLTFQGAQGERVLIDATDSTLPDNCTTLALEDPNGGTMATGCTTAGTGIVDGITLPTSGLYTVVVNPPDANTGHVTLRLLRSRDTHTSLTVDGPPVTVRVVVPGQVGFVSFLGQAGANVAVNITSSTLPAQCVVTLLAPDNRALELGCVNDSGTGRIESTTLPAGGSYTLVVNPDGLATGSAALSVTRS